MPGSGTDKTKRWIETPAPVVILVEPQLADSPKPFFRLSVRQIADADYRVPLPNL